MKEGNPTYQQMCEIIGNIYSDAFLRIQALENENRQLRESQQKTVELASKLREELTNLNLKGKDVKQWNSGKGNSMLPESLQQKPVSESTECPSTSSAQQESIDTSPTKSIAVPVETQNLKGH